jgi:septum formation protein
MSKKLILASQSPRRKELLAQLGYQFDCLPAGIDETVLPDESPYDYVKRIAFNKAQFIAGTLDNNCIVLGSDTSVIFENNILAKPIDLADSMVMLGLLSGKTHQVLTAISVVDAEKSTTQIIETQVTFKTLTEQEIIAYWHTGEPQDKAGSYGIQGIGGQFVSHIAGSYSAVVGLPLYQTAQLLAQFGMPTSLNKKEIH